MVGLRRRGKRVLEDFKAFAHNTRRYDRGRPLAAHASAEWLLYAANPVYIETTQGGTSAARGFGALIWLAGTFFCLTAGGSMVYLGFKDIIIHDDVMGLFMAVLGLVLFIGSAIPGLMVYLSFFAPTDSVVRFDRKRQVVYIRIGKGVVEIPWSSLTPVVQGMAASPMLPGRMYRGLFVEYGVGDEPRTTDGVPHVLQVGQASGGKEGALFFLEHVRRYMEEGPQSVPRPKEGQWLRHRPTWRAMFNFVHLVDGWALEQHERSEAAPWAQTVMFALMFPLMFPLQFTHWLALRVAPLPKWPKELEAQHAADLAELGVRPDGSREAGMRRQPVMRVNGKKIEPPEGQADQPPSEPVQDGWFGRMAAWVAVPLGFLSPLVFWGTLAVVLPIDLSLGQATLLSVGMGVVAVAVTVLSMLGLNKRIAA